MGMEQLRQEQASHRGVCKCAVFAYVFMWVCTSRWGWSLVSASVCVEAGGGQG